MPVAEGLQAHDFTGEGDGGDIEHRNLLGLSALFKQICGSIDAGETGDGIPGGKGLLEELAGVHTPDEGQGGVGFGEVQKILRDEEAQVWAW